MPGRWPRVAVLPRTSAPGTPAKTIRALRRTFDDAQDIVGNTGSGRFVVLSRERPALDRRCLRLLDELATGCVAGIGSPATTVAELHDSYHDASTALFLAARLPGTTRVAHIDDLRVPEIVAAGSQHTRTRFVRALLGDLRAQTDWPTPRQTITAWCECGLNLVRAAAELQIHRNTLIYRRIGMRARRSTGSRAA